MYKIKLKIKQLRKLIRWIPIIWRDRDWDYYFVYEILKQKLIDTEKYIRKDCLHVFNEHDSDSIKTSIEMIENVNVIIPETPVKRGFFKRIFSRRKKSA